MGPCEGFGSGCARGRERGCTHPPKTCSITRSSRVLYPCPTHTTSPVVRLAQRAATDAATKPPLLTPAKTAFGAPM